MQASQALSEAPVSSSHPEEASSALGPAARSLDELQRLVLSVVRDLVGADVDPAAPLGAQGLDSLAAMELRQKLQVACCIHAHYAHARICRDQLQHWQLCMSELTLLAESRI